MCNKWIIFLGLTTLFTLSGLGQKCNITLSGVVHDEAHDDELDLVNIYIKEIETGTITDSDGSFSLENLCPRSYHISLSHIGCTPREIFIDLTADTTIFLTLQHHAHTLDAVVIQDGRHEQSTDISQKINESKILDQANSNLGNLLSSLSGVSSLRTGNSISKPVLQGLFGNRLTLVNNGVAQSGQQWGNDHSPEIDPLSAQSIRTITGVSSLEYMGSHMGALIIVEANKIAKEPHLHGLINYSFQSNGRSHGIHTQLQQYSKKVGWKINGTIKKAGDLKSPRYFLTNTGNTEKNLSGQVEYNHRDRLFTDLYLSTFNTELGVLRGSHINNLTDLESAFSQEVPFFTNDQFSYDINSPRQKVNHHLARIRAKYFLNDEEWIETKIAGQINSRKEFDIRRGSRSDIPSLHIYQSNIFVESKLHFINSDIASTNVGLQWNFIDNTNRPETGILPLIPDYLSSELGVFYTSKIANEKSLLEYGLRGSYQYQNVKAISSNRTIETFNNHFFNYSLGLGYNYEFSDHFLVSTNATYVSRSPAINELYSKGLHQGVSGIEEGNINLNQERSLKIAFGQKTDLNDIFVLETLLFYQRISDFIYLSPSDETRLTIRGAFPVFSYEQSNARLIGGDIISTIQISKVLKGEVKYSYLRGDNLSENSPLVYIPANSLKAKLSFEAKSNHTAKIQNLKLEGSFNHVFRQNHLLPKQDFQATPDAYSLIDIELSGNIRIKNYRTRIVAKIENALNKSYRDYLNRQRYFADDLGRNVSLGIQFRF